MPGQWGQEGRQGNRKRDVVTVDSSDAETASTLYTDPELSSVSHGVDMILYKGKDALYFITFARWKGLVPGEMLSLALLVWSCPFVPTSEVPTWACRSLSRDARNSASVFRAVSRTSLCLVLTEGRAGSAPEGGSCFSYTQP